MTRLKRENITFKQAPYEIKVSQENPSPFKGEGRVRVWMRRKHPPASEHMSARARQLRRDATFPERLLWGRLRDRRCAGLKFRRQQPLGAYVVDYFCAAARIVVELDGRSHDEQEAQDGQRQDYLERQGLTVIRFTNDQVLADLDGVVEAIGAACTLTRPSGPTSPFKGEG